MKVRLLQNWNWYKAGDVADVFEPLAKNWIHSGLAETVEEARAVVVERAVEDEDRVERAVVTERRKQHPARKG
jgi:hypothetical protein